MSKKGIMIFTSFLVAFEPIIGIIFTVLYNQQLEWKRQGYLT